MSLSSTKRSVLKASAKIFDPIRLLSPSTINLMVLFQWLCCDHVDCDDELDDKSFACWISLLQGLESLILLKVPSLSKDPWIKRCFRKSMRSGPLPSNRV